MANLLVIVVWGALIILVGMLGFLLFKRQHGKRGKAKKGKIAPAPNTLVLDTEAGYGLEYIKKPKGRLWRYGKLWVYAMRRHNSALEPVVLPEKLGILPETLYRALSWEKESDILFTIRNTLAEKLTLFGIYILIGILLFFMYLIFSSL